MKSALIGMMAACFLVSGLRAQWEGGISAEIVPGQVRPGDLFELRVAMDRADYARFKLIVPGHDRLHRVAVEAVPVRLNGGRYRQEENWLLQANSSGPLQLEGLTVLLETGGAAEVVMLPPLKVEVLPYEHPDGDAQPMTFPKGRTSAVGKGQGQWRWLVPLLVVLFGVAWWMRKANPERSPEGDREPCSLPEVLGALEAGTVDSSALHRLMEDQSAGWSDELREAVGEMLYGGRGDARELAALLRKEVAK